MLIKIAQYTIRVMPESAASAIVRALAPMTRRPPVSSFEQEAMARASRMSYGENNKNVAWVWGDGPLVVCVHGWSGRAAQMAPLALHVANLRGTAAPSVHE